MEKTKNTIDKVRLIKTVLLILFMFYQGMFINGFYGTLLDFTEILDTHIEYVSLGLSLRCLGSCIGCFAGAFIFNRCDRFMACALFLSAEGIASILITTSHYLIIYYSSLFVIGFSTGAVETGLYVIVADLWKDKSKPFIQSIDFSDILSMIVAPLFVRPFLSHDEAFDDLDFADTVPLHNQTVSNTTFVIEAHNPSRIWIPFTVIGLMMVSSSILASFLQCYSHKETKQSQNCEEKCNNENTIKNQEKENEAEKQQEKVDIMKGIEEQIIRKYEISVTAICCLMVFFGNAMFSKSKGLIMFSALCGIMAITSFVSLLIAIKLKPIQMLLIYLSFLITGDIVLLSFGSHSEPFLWLGAIL
ncbi:Sodium-dependent glucose transporter 1-like protein, partial [Leptotrombidium deliense]